ncbi:hypothetical protein LY90DRAFT_674031 [Neocallimastix californiae]|uniref:EGF-like domain-containing protein n=1 Tax=Neocallimastix californiae TaxID=1754190 RepID=A0A1Y2B1Z6_9FUNG|nr:hypothetical protein LY90DRAFT_674031 [Neocallimastix californiae]|eukprot:ORY28851.1 hypothetical protein LY90DRAFT_674031 [Neocallimastix californiae]
MNILFQYIFICIFIFCNKLGYTKEFIIKSNEVFFNNLLNIINNNQEENELILYFTDDYYDLTKVSKFKFDISIESNISFIGNEKGTVFDYKGDSRGTFELNFHNVHGYGKTIKFNNIVFKNYYANTKVISGVQIIQINSFSLNFFVILNNCIFQNNFNKIIYVNLEILNKSLKTDLKIENDVLIQSSAFYSTKGRENNLIIENSIFENIYVKSLVPLIKNTCSIFKGDKCKYNISNLIIENTNLRNPIPLFANSKYSEFNITNSIFRNLKLRDKLFGEESKYNFENNRLENIQTNSEALLYFIYNDININKLEAINITCFGDIDNASFILYYSGTNRKRLSMENIEFKNIKSNGSFIKITGEFNEFSIKDSTIENIISFGSIIDIESENTNIEISKLNFNNNINNNKLKCGSIHLRNNLKVKIEDSNFIHNHSKSNGGALCFDNFLTMDMDLISNYFYENRGFNGGALYLINDALSNKNTKDKDCIFFNNTVSYHDSNYATRPSILSLDTAIENIKIFTGDYLPLEFTVHDEFGDKIEDVYNNYSTITMVISMYEKDEYIENYYLDQKRHENNNIMFSVLSMHIKYNLLGNIGTFKHGKFELKYLQIFAKPGNYVLNVEIENYNYKLKFDFKKIEIEVLGCNENQITILSYHKICYMQTFYNTSINDPDKNKCVCLPGWSGKLCENHIWVEFNCNFMSYSTSSEYINYFIFRNIGISLFISIVLIFNTLSSELSKLNKNVQFSIDDYSFNDYNNKTENNYCQNSNYNQYTNTKKSGINMSVNNSNGAFKSETLSYEKDDDESNILQNKNGQWSYHSKIESIDVGLNILYLLLLVNIIIGSKNILERECIFKYVYNIYYSSFIGITLGPLINVIGYGILSNQRYIRSIFECSLNMLCYFIIFIIFSWDKIYYVFKKDCDNPNVYFIYKRHELCGLHNSDCCGCKLNISKEDYLSITQRYFDFYTVCSSIFMISEGKIRFIRIKSKTEVFGDKKNFSFY